MCRVLNKIKRRGQNTCRAAGPMRYVMLSRGAHVIHPGREVAILVCMHVQPPKKIVISWLRLMYTVS